MDVERFEKRLWKAVRTLEEINTDPSVYRDREEERIRGKIEGVKLALSYLGEERNHDSYYCGVPECRDEHPNAECGDFPAPCNCDDPETHNGH